jgi:hypothetical protein
LLRAVYARQRSMVKPEDMVCLQCVTKAFSGEVSGQL